MNRQNAERSPFSVPCLLSTVNFRSTADGPFRIALAGSLLTACAASAAEMDLFVTDYAENRSADQKPLVALPIVYSARWR